MLNPEERLFDFLDALNGIGIFVCTLLVILWYA